MSLKFVIVSSSLIFIFEIIYNCLTVCLTENVAEYLNLSAMMIFTAFAAFYCVHSYCGRSILLRSHYCGHIAAVTLLRSHYCGHITAVTLLRSHCCGHITAFTLLRSHYCGHITAVTLLRSQLLRSQHFTAFTLLRSQHFTAFT
jgi:hypothetical protein